MFRKARIPAPKIYPETMSYAYRMIWMPPGANPHGWAGRPPPGYPGRMTGCASSLILKAACWISCPGDTGMSSVLEVPESAQMLEKQLIKNPVTGGWRLVFLVRLPKEEGVLQSIRAAREGAPSLRFKAVLKKGENLPDPLTETWVYDLQL